MDAQRGNRRPLAQASPSRLARTGSVDDRALASSAPLQFSGQEPQTQNQQEKQHRRVACRDCRQAKLRCDALEGRIAGPCSRCRRLSLDCQVDSGYKRVNKKVKLDELAEQLEQLRSVVGKRDHSSNAASEAVVGSTDYLGQSPGSNSSRQIQSQQSSPHSAANENHRPADHTRQNDNYHSQSQNVSQSHEMGNQSGSFLQPTVPRSQSFSSSSSRSLENVELHGHQISQLFHDFFLNYHHFLEVLEPGLSPDQYYARSPLLFWSIVTVAARRYEADVTLLASLVPCVTRLIWSTVSVLPHSRFSVQALLLIANWSLPTSSMSTDISFMAVTIAKTAAMQLGLHRPETAQDFLRVKTSFGPQEFQEVVKIWAGCFITTHSVTSAIGQPASFADDWAINQASELGNRYTLPDNLRHLLLIHKYMARVAAVMAENNGSPTGYPGENESCVLMAILERDFVDLERQIGPKLSASHQVILLTACLQLRTYYFFMTSNSEIRKEGLLKAYATSLTLIEKTADLNAKWGFIKYAPNGYLNMLIMSGMLLMKIVNSSYSAYIDADAGKKTFNNVLSMVRATSVEDNDLRGRVSKIMAQLWSVHHSLSLRRDEEPVIHIKTRWGASLLHDSLWMWREEFGGQRGAVSQAAPAASPAMNNISPAAAVVGEDDNKNFNRQDGWRETIMSQDLASIQETNMQMAYSDPNNLGALQVGFPDPDWIWDIGFPSFAPLDVDFYSPTQQSY